MEWLERFYSGPAGQLVFTTVLAYILTATYGAFKDWRNKAIRSQNLESAEEEENRDWRIRCLRTEKDLENLDNFVERLKLKNDEAANHVRKAILCLRDDDVLKSDGSQRTREEIITERRVLASLLQYMLTDMTVEFKAHERERPLYLERLKQPQPLRPDVPPLPPASEEEVKVPGLPGGTPKD